VYREPERVEVADVPDPQIEDAGDAIIRVSRTAICGSDLHFFHGKAPLEPGDVIGHEVAGIVERTGSRLTRFATGDRVVASFDIACGECWFCRRGQTSLCEDFRNLGAGVFGGGLAGAQAEFVRIPHADVNLLAVPDDVDDERAMFVGDALTTGVYAAGVAEIRPGDTVAIVGVGPVGYFAIQSVMLHEPGRILAIDVDRQRLTLAERIGAATIDSGASNPQSAVFEHTDGRGADVVIEAVGNVSAFETALQVVRRGGIVVVVGMYTSETYAAQLGVWWARSLGLRFAGLCPIHAWWDRAMAHVQAGRIDPVPLISHRLPLEEAPLGYELFDSRRATKVLLVP
jgi:threonine dehydrogenase-like Zn-dependent dehydrogenase